MPFSRKLSFGELEKAHEETRKARDWLAIFYNTKQVDMDRVHAILEELGQLGYCLGGDLNWKSRITSFEKATATLLPLELFTFGGEEDRPDLVCLDFIFDSFVDAYQPFFLPELPIFMWPFNSIYTCDLEFSHKRNSFYCPLAASFLLPALTFAYDVYLRLGGLKHKVLDLFAELGLLTPSIRLIRESDKKYVNNPRLIVCDTPSRLDIISNGVECLLHNDGPALELRSGLRFYYVNGIQVPPIAVVEGGRHLTGQDVLAFRDAEVRRTLREILGEERFVKDQNLRIIDVDTKDVSKVDYGDARSVPRMLVRAESGDRFFVGTDGSTGRVYYMPVPGSCNHCGEAHEWLCGFNENRIVSQS